MTRLNNFLFEYGNSDRIEGKEHRSVPIPKDTFLNMKEKYCKQAENSNIYRGVKNRNEEQYLFINPAQHTRVSEYTDNWYMLLMELLPQWKKYPKLSKSIICTTKMGEADNWGSSVYKVYPYDNAILAVAPARHFWGSFTYDMAFVNSAIYTILKSFKMRVHENETDPNKLKKVFDIIDSADKSAFDVDEALNLCANGYAFSDIFENIKNGMPILKALEEVLPADGFSLKKIGDKLPENKQVWTESPCLLELIQDEEEDY